MIVLNFRTRKLLIKWQMQTVQTQSDHIYGVYGKCLNILYRKASDKMAYANSLDPDQTAPDQGLDCLPFHEVFKETTA